MPHFLSIRNMIFIILGIITLFIVTALIMSFASRKNTTQPSSSNKPAVSQEIIDSLTAPHDAANEQKTPEIPPAVMKSLSAPVNDLKSEGTRTINPPVPQSVLDSLSAPP